MKIRKDRKANEKREKNKIRKKTGEKNKLKDQIRRKMTIRIGIKKIKSERKRGQLIKNSQFRVRIISQLGKNLKSGIPPRKGTCNNKSGSRSQTIGTVKIEKWWFYFHRKFYFIFSLHDV